VKTKTWLALPAALALIALAAIAVGCGDDDSSGGRGNDTDAAFVNDMVPHHEAAVEMAMLANTRAEHPELRRLADDIIAAQNREIDTMSSVKADLAGEHGDHMAGDAHMSGDEHSRGMGMDPQELRDAKPFDREFIDMMIPHHQGAIRMARMQLDEGKDPEVRKLAQAIIDAQAKEIDEMNTWRVDWYGGLSPAGGVPAEAHEEAEHH